MRSKIRNVADLLHFAKSTSHVSAGVSGPLGSLGEGRRGASRQARRMVLGSAFCLLTSAGVLAGTFNVGYFAELDGTFSGGNSPAPGRSTVAHDVSGSNLTDFGIAAFSDPGDGRITSIALIDINNADTNLWGLGVARFLYTGAVDTNFGGGDGRIEYTNLGITTIVDACQDSQGRYVIAAAAPGANGSGGAKDLALIRLTGGGTLDTSYSGDGINVFSIADSGGERDEAINDLECLPNGDYFIGGYIIASNGNKSGLIARMPSAGQQDVPVASGVFGLSSGDAESQITAIHFNTNNGAYVVANTIIGTTNPNRSILQHLAMNVSAFEPIASIPNVFFGSDQCITLATPSIVGISPISGTDYALSLLYSDASVRKAAVARANIGESLLVSCTQAPFSLGNAAVTPPLVYGGTVFVALGFAPLNGTPVPSQMRAYVPSASGLSLLVESNFGNNGLTTWQHSFQTSNANNNRSFVQRLFVDPAGLIMAVGTRIWNGNDTDVALTRFGSSGVFNNSFENPQ